MNDSDDPSSPNPGHPENGPNQNGDAPESQEVRHTHIGALVPQHVAAGAFSTGAVVLQGQHEFILDFLLRMQQPQQVAARIIVPPPVMAQFIQALQENLKKHEARFGPIAMPEVQPPPENASQATAQDLYEQLKIPETIQSGAYANAVMIGHTATEFSFDFITTFFPRSAVSARVFLSAPTTRKLLDSMLHSYGQYQQRQGQTPPNPPYPDAPPGSGTFDT